MPFDDHKNFAISAVALAPSPADSGTSLFVTTGQGTRFPTPPFNASVWPADAVADPANAEIVRVTAVTDDLFAITRAQEASTARSVIVGDQIAATITDKTLTDIEALESAIDAVEALVTDTLTVLARSTAPIDVVNTATETTVFTATVPGGTLGTDGFVDLVLTGDFLNNAGITNTLTLKVKYGGTMAGIALSNLPTTLYRGALALQARVSAAGTTAGQRAQTVVVLGNSLTNSAGNPPEITTAASQVYASVHNALALNAAVAQALSVTVQWGSASAQSSARVHTVQVVAG